MAKRCSRAPRVNAERATSLLTRARREPSGPTSTRRSQDHAKKDSRTARSRPSSSTRSTTRPRAAGCRRSSSRARTPRPWRPTWRTSPGIPRRSRRRHRRRPARAERRTARRSSRRPAARPATRSPRPGASGTVGPNLDQAKPSVELAIDRVTNGKGAMPSFKGQLTEAEIRAVAQFVNTSAGK